jgi:hypothetical protein
MYDLMNVTVAFVVALLILNFEKVKTFFKKVKNDNKINVLSESSVSNTTADSKISNGPVSNTSTAPLVTPSQEKLPVIVADTKTALESKYIYKGCYVDKPSKDLPISVGNMSLDECALAAKIARHNVFGIQASDNSGFGGVGGECYLSQDGSYGKYGVANNCTINDAGQYLGQVGSNAIYEWE